MNTVIIAPFGLLIVVAVIVGLVMLVRALPPGSGPKVALGVGGLLALIVFAMFFVKSQHTLVPQVPVVVQGNSVIFEHPATSVSDDTSFPTIFYSARLLLILIAVAVLVGILYLIYHLARSPGGRTTLVVGGIGLVLLAMFFVGYQSLNISGEKVAYKQSVRQLSGRSGEQNVPENQYQGIIDPVAVAPKEASKPDANSSTVTESEPTKPTPGTTAEKTNGKPAWLIEGTQTGNGVSQFPVSSELFATVVECQRDLDSRMSGLIAAEARFLVGEEYPMTLLPGEAQRLIAGTYTEDVTTSQGTWYKVHRLIKIDQSTWDMFRLRFQQAQLQARVETIGFGFGGLMLVLGVVYLFLRRKPRVVDPTLNTFSTT